MKSIRFYVASDTPDGGIYSFTFDGEKCCLHGAANCPRPAYIASCGEKMYVLLRAPFGEKSDSSGVAVFDIQSDGKLIQSEEIIPTGGAIAAHLCVLKNRIYVANYISGETVRLTDKCIRHEGSGPHPTRQLSPHPHIVTPTPDEKYLAVCDLGCDKIYILSPELEPVSETRMPAGSGSRHLVFSRDGAFAYCANELSSTVTSLAYSDGKLKRIADYPTIPEHTTDSFPAAIRYDSCQVLVSNRGHDSIAVFDADGGKLVHNKFINTRGHYPRDFIVISEFIIIADELDDRVVILNRNGEFICEVYVRRPLCVSADKIT